MVFVALLGPFIAKRLLDDRPNAPFEPSRDLFGLAGFGLFAFGDRFPPRFCGHRGASRIAFFVVDPVCFTLGPLETALPGVSDVFGLFGTVLENDRISLDGLASPETIATEAIRLDEFASASISL